VNGLIIATSVVATALGGPFFGLARPGPEVLPKPFDENVTLPGKIPPSAKSISGSWMFTYQLQNAAVEGRNEGDLLVSTALMLREDGTYQLHYSARWNLPRPVLGGVVPTVDERGGMNGRNVSETGRFTLSGEVLILKPDRVDYHEVEKNALVNQQQIENESHTLIIRLNKAHLSVAGRCASWQVDPICRDTPIIWYPMKASLGPRWLGREN
jgi:hypothetical protein